MHKPSALLQWVHRAASTLQNPLSSCSCLGLTWVAAGRRVLGALWLPQSLAGQCCTWAKTWHPSWRRCRGSGRRCHCSGYRDTAPVAPQSPLPALHAQTHALRIHTLAACRVCWIPCRICRSSLFDVLALLQHLPSSCSPKYLCLCTRPGALEGTLVIRAMCITMARICSTPTSSKGHLVPCDMVSQPGLTQWKSES